MQIKCTNRDVYLRMIVTCYILDSQNKKFVMLVGGIKNSNNNKKKIKKTLKGIIKKD